MSEPLLKVYRSLNLQDHSVKANVLVGDVSLHLALLSIESHVEQSQAYYVLKIDAAYVQEMGSRLIPEPARREAAQ